jgi:hypothetical protein
MIKKNLPKTIVERIGVFCTKYCWLLDHKIRFFKEKRQFFIETGFGLLFHARGITIAAKLVTARVAMAPFYILPLRKKPVYDRFYQNPFKTSYALLNN